jgi:hypothetical protein
MADLKISQLGSIVTVVPATDVLPVVQGGTTYKVTPNQLLGAGGTATLASATITGDLTVDTNTLFVNSTTNRVGIATATPAEKLTIDNTLGAGAIGLRVFANDQSTARMGVHNTNGQSWQFVAGYAGANNQGLSIFDSTTNANRLYLDTSGNANIINGNLIIGTSGKGIDFSATANSSGTMTSELLNDYEEGTWVGTLTGGTTNPTIPVTATGRYTKIGRIVTVQIYFNNVNTVGASGLLGVTGLPFACNASNGSTGVVSFVNLATFTGSPFIALGVNESFLNCFSNISNSAFGNVTHNAGASANYLTTSVTYTVA